MFLLRSAFWLTVMFVIVAPKDVDLGKTAGEYSRQALEAGQKAIVGQILANDVLASDCDTIECAGGKAVLTVLAGNKLPSVDLTMQDSSTKPVPFPRPRPARMG